MCINYKVFDEDLGINELKIGIGDLFCCELWDVDVWFDYCVLVIFLDGDGLFVEVGVFGFWLKFI